MKTNNTAEKTPILTRTDLLTGLLCLAGMIPGLVCYNRLPDSIPVHWNIHNQPDNWANRNFVIFALPLLMIVLHLICCAADHHRGRKDSAPPAMNAIVRLIIPVITLVLECVTVLFVLNLFTNIGLVCCVLLGIMLVIIGNYLPKTRPNRTIGIRLPVTLRSEEVWRRTHRLAGWVEVIGGIADIILAFMGLIVPAAVVIFVAALLPIPAAYIINARVSSN